MSGEVIIGGYAVDKKKAYCRWIDDSSDLYETEYLSAIPVDPVPVPPTAEELKASALSKIDEILSLAATRIAPLQDAVDLEKPDADTALLIKWKQYRIDVNAVSAQKGFPAEIVWPIEPS